MSAFELSREQMRAAVGLLQQYFFSREDVLATRSPGGNPRPGKGKLIPLLSAHVAGEVAPPATVRYETRRGMGAESGHFRIGSYCLNGESNVRWLCLDFDGGADHAASLEDPLGAALATQEAFAAHGIPGYLERSGGGQGWHVWVFFAVPVPAVKARRLAFALVPRGWLKTDWTPAEPESGRGIEIFPKQDRIGKKGFGNLVWLPWWHGAAEGGNQFVRVGAERGSLECWFPAEGFETVSAEQLEAVLAQLPAVVPSASPGSGSAPNPVYTPGDHRQSLAASPQTNPDPAWESWRAEALSRLRVEDIYGEWLTGESSSPGWLQCRDPWSASGDKNPSAGVADGTGTAERGTFHSFISGKSLSPFDFLVTMGRASSFSDALRQVAQMTGTPAPVPSQAREDDGLPIEFDLPGGNPPSNLAAPAQPSAAPAHSLGKATANAPSSPAAPSPPAERRPEVITNGRQLRDILRDAWNAIIARNSMGQPFIFQRAGQIVRLRRSDRHGPLMIDPLDDVGMLVVLAQHISWFKASEDGNHATTPTRDLARMMLSTPDPRLPVLSSIMTTPGFGASGCLIRTNGYHAADCVWFDGKDQPDFGSVPEDPTPDDIAAARSLLLDDLAVDFPFATPSDRAHFLAAVLLPFVRRLIPTATPLHLFEAPSVGSGKSLLCSTIALVTTGQELATSSVPEQDEEFRKVITSKLLVGSPIILLDNAREKKLFDSPSLAAALTSTTWVDRVLGSNKLVALPNLASWFLTGNNPRLSMELLRRSVRIRLNPNRQRAWQREGFKHDPLLEWVRANRAELVKACLVLIQAWVKAGRPAGKRRLGSFEPWAFTMGGILDVGGVEGFLSNLNDIYDEADNESQEWIAFVSEWWDRFGSSARKVSELLALCEERELMVDVRGPGTEKSQQARLGKALAATRDQIFGTLRIDVAHDPRLKTKTYRLRRVDDDPGSRSTPDMDLFGETAPETNGTNGKSPAGNPVGRTAAPRNGAHAGQPACSRPAGKEISQPSAKVASDPANPAGGNPTYRKPTAVDPHGLTAGNTAVCKTPAVGAVGAVGFSQPTRMHADTRVCAHACVKGSIPENLPHLPQGSIKSSNINNLEGGASKPDLPQPTATSRKADSEGASGSSEQWELPDLADFDTWDDDPQGDDPSDDADNSGAWQDPPS
jgi:hypothetical protein